MPLLLPSIDAALNFIAAVLLIRGYILIRRKQIQTHRKVMITAFVVSCLFLASILGTHTALAAIVPVLAIITLRRGLSQRFDRHRAIARWTLPIWLYVSVTGVVVYVMLYHM